MIKNNLFLLFLLFSTGVFAQKFDISAEIRPRFESRNGYKALLPKDASAGNAISQRTRLNFDYKSDIVKLKLTLQNIRVWGDVSTLAKNDKNSALHEAWAEVRLIPEKLYIKLGRQEIIHDDHRIFGSVGWAQQARSHDAAIFKYTVNDAHKLDLGFAYNADKEALVSTPYSNAASYKTFQYLKYNGKFNKIGVSFLLLNTGVEREDKSTKKLAIDNRQTIGPRVTYKKGKLDANAAYYMQLGKVSNTKVNAAYFSANLGYKVTETFKAGLGFEYLSGKDADDKYVGVDTFSPLFGTNHKFNGWMDYFYVGFENPTGLKDIYMPLAYTKGKFFAKLIPHYFASAANVVDKKGTVKNSYLGTEVDFMLGYKIAKGVTLSGGYSKMFATDTMEIVKKGDKNENNSWGWIMFTIKPKLFSFSAAKK